MIVDGIHPDKDFRYAVVGEDEVLVFTGYQNGLPGSCITLRCKTSSGDFINLTPCAHLITDPLPPPVSSDSSESSDSPTPPPIHNCDNPPTVTGVWCESVWGDNTCWWDITGGNSVSLDQESCTENVITGGAVFSYSLFVDGIQEGYVDISYESQSSEPTISYSSSIVVVSEADLYNIDCFGESYCIVVYVD